MASANMEIPSFETLHVPVHLDLLGMPQIHPHGSKASSK